MRTAAILGVGFVVGSVAGSYATVVGLYRAVGDVLPRAIGHRIADGIISQGDKAIERAFGPKPQPKYVHACKHDPSR